MQMQSHKRTFVMPLVNDPILIRLNISNVTKDKKTKNINWYGSKQNAIFSGIIANKIENPNIGTMLCEQTHGVLSMSKPKPRTARYFDS